MATVDQIKEDEDLELQAKENVKPGDKWFKFTRFDKYQAVDVTKVTKTLIIFSDGERMSRTTSKIFGHGRFYYRPATAARIAKLEQEANSKKVDSILQEALTKAQAISSALSLDKRVELTNLLNGFFDTL